MLLGLLIVSSVLFVGSSFGSSAVPALIYAPVPFLFWAAIRLGPLGTSASLLTVALFAVWGTIHGHGPFVTASPEESALSTQLFLIMLSITLLLLSSVVEQNRKTAKALQQSEEQLRLAIGAAKIGTWDWSIPQQHRDPGRTKRSACLASRRTQLRPCLKSFDELLHPDDRDAVEQAVSRAIDGKLPFEVEFRVVLPNEPTSAGYSAKERPCTTLLARPDRMVGVNVDITDRKRSEEILLDVNENLRKEIADRVRVEQALRSSEERFGKAFHFSPRRHMHHQTSGRPAASTSTIAGKSYSAFIACTALGRTLAELGIVRNAADQAQARPIHANAQGQEHDLELSLSSEARATYWRSSSPPRVTEMSGEPCRISVIRDVTRAAAC